MASFAELREKARLSACLIRDDKERLEFAHSFVFATIHRFWEAVQRSSEPAPSWLLPDFLEAQQIEPLAGTEQTVLSRSIAELVSGIDAIEAGYCLGRLYTALIPDNLRSQYGVYYTPPVLAERLMDMAEAAGVDWSRDTVLDPACGGGAFLAPVARRMATALSGKSPLSTVRHIAEHLEGFEIDPFAAWLTQVFLEVTLIELLRTANLRLPPLVRVKDTLSDEKTDTSYDVVIGNPPYGKVRLNEHERRRYQRSLYGHANLYGLFVDQALRFAGEGGVIAYVTPTSFLAGQYFKELRTLLHYLARPTNIDLVSARSGIFEDVLQETLLITCRKKNRSKIATAHVLELTSLAQLKVTPVGEFDFPVKGSAPWIIPRSAGQSRIVRGLNCMRSRLRDYGYRVRTGPLVWNRHKSQLRMTPSSGCYPLIWAESITKDGQFVFRAKKKNHRPFYEPKAKEDWLIVRHPCVLLQRTTAKEQNRRLVAAELPRSFIEQHGAVVIENHVNMVIPTYGQAKVSPAALAAILNSRVVDEAFRCINGSVAVSAYELAALPLPSIEQALRIQEMLQAGSTRDDVERELERIYAQAESAAPAAAHQSDPPTTGKDLPRRVAEPKLLYS